MVIVELHYFSSLAVYVCWLTEGFYEMSVRRRIRCASLHSSGVLGSWFLGLGSWYIKYAPVTEALSPSFQSFVVNQTYVSTTAF